MTKKELNVFLGLNPNSTQDYMPMPHELEIENLETMGIEFTGLVLKKFIPYTLPAGWENVRLNATQIQIVDDKNRPRIRMTFLSQRGLSARFSKSNSPPQTLFTGILKINARISIERGEEDENFGTAHVQDGSNILFRTWVPIDKSEEQPLIHAQSQATEEAKKWADKHFPDRQNHFAYWDVDDLMTLVN